MGVSAKEKQQDTHYFLDPKCRSHEKKTKTRTAGHGGCPTKPSWYYKGMDTEKDRAGVSVVFPIPTSSAWQRKPVFFLLLLFDLSPHFF